MSHGEIKLDSHRSKDRTPPRDQRIAKILQNWLVLVRYGPRFLKICWFWSGSVRELQKFVGPGPVGPRFSENIRFWSEWMLTFSDILGFPWSWISQFFSVLDTGPIEFGPWIPGSTDKVSGF